MEESILQPDAESQFGCPVCSTGVMNLGVETPHALIYTCTDEACGAALWVPTAAGHAVRFNQRIRLAKLKTAAQDQKNAAPER
jgi:hypothetical protein